MNNTTKPPVTPTAAHIAVLKAQLPADEQEFTVPVELAPLADYAVVVTAEHDALDGVYWEGFIYRAGAKVLVVGNRGDGGPNVYYGLGGTQSIAAGVAEEKAFKAAAREAFPSLYEPEDAATAFLDLVWQIGGAR